MGERRFHLVCTSCWNSREKKKENFRGWLRSLSSWSHGSIALNTARPCPRSLSAFFFSFFLYMDLLFYCNILLRVWTYVSAAAFATVWPGMLHLIRSKWVQFEFIKLFFLYSGKHKETFQSNFPQYCLLYALGKRSNNLNIMGFNSQMYRHKWQW